MESGIQSLETVISKTLRRTCICLIALVILAECTQISGALAEPEPPQLPPLPSLPQVELAQGESYDLGYDGYVLTVRQTDPDAGKVWLSLSRYGKEVDSEVLDTTNTNSVYCYDPDTGKNPVIKTKVEVYRGGDIGMVRLWDICLRNTPNIEQTVSHTVSPTTIDYLHITADVNNGYAITTVEEKLTNPNDAATDDEFRFLIPDSAFISGFSLFIDGIEYRADVLPRKEAQERFNEAVSKGRTAGILKAKKRDIFSYSLSFAPHQSIIVRLTYEQPVKKMLGEYEYVLSLRETDVAHTVPDLSVNITVASVNRITTLETPGFEGAKIRYLSATKARVTYSAGRLPDQDLRIVFTTDNTSLSGEMLFYETGGQGYLMHVFSPSEEDLGTTALDKEIIFVIDKSGSMRGDKIAQVKRVFTGIIADLPPDDYFNVIFFDSNVRMFKKNLMEANTETKAEAANFVAALDAEGGTNINEALLTTLGMFKPDTGRVPIIVFLTDGEPTEGVTSPYVIRENVKAANDAEVSIFVIAFGIEDEENYDFLRALSLENCGVAERFYPEENAETRMNTFYKTISTPVITDMRFDYSDSSDVVNTGYSTLFAGSDAIILARYPAGINGIESSIDAVTRTGSRTFGKTFPVVSRTENAFIPKLWAYTKIRRLMDRMTIEGETDDLVSEITDLSLEFGFVTPYTSLFVEVPTINKSETRATASGVEGEAEEAPVEVAAEEAVPAVAPKTSAPVLEGAEEADAGAERVTEAPAGARPPVPAEAPTAKKKTPGFGAVVAITGLAAVAYLVRRRG